MRRSVLSVLAAGLVVAGCGSSGAGAGAEGNPDSSVVPDRAGAPEVVAPRDLRAGAADPCALLSPTRTRALDVLDRGTASTNNLGPTCTWEGREASSRTIQVSVVVTRDLFVDTYRARALAVFRPGQTAGSPSVDSKTSDTDPVCTTTVGVADGQTLDVSASLGSRSSGESEADSCAISRRVAEEIVSTLPPR